LSVLGGFGLRRNSHDHVAVPGGSQKLLAFLALHPGTIARSLVAGTLWPDVPDGRASSSLRSAVARLGVACRRTVEVSPLQLGMGERVSVDISDARSIAGRLIDPNTEPRPTDLGLAAIDALSADLLPGWYDDWVMIEAEDWRLLRLHALEAMTSRLVRAGRLAEAATAAGAAVRVEPLRETARAALIEVHRAAGNQAEAVREFDRYSILLQAELGLDPTPRLRRLAAAGCNSDVPPATSPAAADR
jgi:DNA-binding SARP family transcriptional activator